jgi:hypothetical protein
VITDIRRAIHQHLDRPLSDREWQLIDNQGLLSRVREGKMDPAGVAAHVTQWRIATGAHQTTSAPSTPPAPKFRADPARKAREDLLSYFLSIIAARLSPVETFRREVLSNGMLKVADVEAWIEKHARAEGYTLTLEIPVRPDEQGSKQTDRSVTLSAEWPAKLQWLKYILPDQKSQSVRTAAGGVLDRLRLASEHVTAQTGVPEAYATLFILCDSPLPFFSCDQRLVIASTDTCSALNRIELSIDPTLSPRQVAEVYRWLRAQVFGKRRYRAMSEKHIRLALFTLSRGSDEPLKNAMAAWNRENKKRPRWCYRHESNFGRDRVRANRRAFAALNATPTSHSAVEDWLFGRTAERQSRTTTKKTTRSTR